MPNWDVERLYCMNYQEREMNYEKEILPATVEPPSAIELQVAELENAQAALTAAEQAVLDALTAAEQAVLDARKAKDAAYAVLSRAQRTLTSLLGFNASAVGSNGVYSNISGCLYTTKLKQR